MQINELLTYIESFAPLGLQEDFDNSGLIVGNPHAELSGALITLDVTPQILEEAIENKCNLIISHHPLIFQGVKKILPFDTTGQLLIKAIQHNLVIYAAHTNLDNVLGGVNGILAQKLGLKNVQILNPLENRLRKLTTFCPVGYAEKVRQTLFAAGGGCIGNYDNCSYNVEGYGTFRASENAKPFVGEIGKIHVEKETRIEVVYPDYIEKTLIQALKSAHPYEEVAFDCISLQNSMPNAGSGVIGELSEPTDIVSFLEKVKNTLGLPTIRHSIFQNKKIEKVALCGGSGSFLIRNAKKEKADIFLTADLKYHDFQQGSENFIIADIGHYESEQFAKELIYSLICEKFTTFALLISKHTTNYINYL